jgi:Flp pilus assembly protein TadD
MRRWALSLVGLAIFILGSALGACGQAEKSYGAKEQASLDKAAKDYLSSGLLLAAEGRDEEAVKAFRQALAIRPNWAEARSLLGSSLARTGNYRDAEQELRKAVELKPDYAEGWYYLGIFLKDQGKGQEAQAAFDKAKQHQRRN